MTELSNKDELLVYLAAQGKNNTEIAALLECSPANVSHKLGEDHIQFEIRHIRQKLYGKDAKNRIQALLPHALDVTEEVLTNPNVKLGLKYQAAEAIMDRAMGKPTQKIEHEGSLIRSLFERLDEEKKVVQTIDVTARPNQVRLLDNPNERTKPEVSLDNPNTNPVDDWVNKNL